MNANGLEGIVVADTELSHVDGEGGRLVLRGHPVEALARHTFEDVCALFWDGVLPTESRREATRAALGAAREEAFMRLSSLGDALDAERAMDALRAAVAHVPSDPNGDIAADGIRLTGAVGTFAVAWARRHAGQAPVAPDPAQSHAADLLAMLHGPEGEPRRTWTRGLDAYLCAVVDHGLNASTFAARVVASTESDTISSVVAAIGALKGRLHGGAPGPVLDMLDAVGEPTRAELWVRHAVTHGERIMGIGHRVYRVRDPRAAVLEDAVRALGAEARPGRIELARAVEEAAVRVLAELKPGRRLAANVEFYTAVLLEAIGIPRTLFTAIFAASRVVGWTAHVAEQRRTGRLIRPRARYVGAMPDSEAA